MNIETKTINDLRTLSTSPAPGTFYYITDPGKEGEWYYDGTDIITKDNRGTVVTSPSNPSSGASRKVFRRVYDSGFVNAPWFFESNDPDATLGIQKALDFISDTSYLVVNNNTSPQPGIPVSGGGTVFLPKGNYFISKSLIIGQHCRLLGVAKSATYYNDNTSGSVIIVNPNTIENPNMWAIQSATYFINPDLTPIPPFPGPGNPDIINFNSFCDDAGYYFKLSPSPIILPVTDTHAIKIEQITIYCNEIYGGIKLTNSPYSEIKSVSVFAANIGIYLNNCWNNAIYDSYIRRVNWYGIVLAETNVCSIINCAVSGKSEDQSNSEKYLIPETELPLFVTKCDFKNVDVKARRGRTGIFICMYGNANQILNCSSEVFTNGIITLSNSNLDISTAYIEDIIYYGIITASGVLLTQINTIYFERIGIAPYTPIDIANSYPFYFGEDTSAQIATVSCRTIQQNVGKLFKIETDDAYITFANTQYADRTYHKQVLFIDEAPNGANLGAIYIDPTNGNDYNYGFNKNDAVKTFDAALVRVQNQSTINPVKTIRIKDGATVLKDVTIKEIENCNLLITGYTDSGEGVSNPCIYFEVTNDIILIGGFKILGNVSLYFRNVDLICNPYYQLPTQLNQKTIFNLYHAYCKIVFDNLEIDLAHSYSLIKSIESNSSIETKFVDTNIIGTSNSSLSPSNNGIINILVDNSQIGSVLSPSIYSQFNTGWLDANTIRNNF